VPLDATPIQDLRIGEPAARSDIVLGFTPEGDEHDQKDDCTKPECFTLLKMRQAKVTLV
jgi:hypothetical protein